MTNAVTETMKLFTEGSIGCIRLKNRAVMPAMGTNMSDAGMVNSAVINHYQRRAEGGVGLIIVEVTCVDAPLGLNTPDMLRIDEDVHIAGHRKLANAIHQHDARAFLQLSHTGRGAKPDVIGGQPVGPSAVAMPYSFMMGLSGVEPKELTINEIQAIEDKYAKAALRAKQAGYDGVEIHSTGYYLGQQFLSSHANRRTDEYGGSKENRATFITNIIKKVKRLCGVDFPVIVKLSVVEQGQYAGITLSEGIYYAYRVQEAGADAIEVLAGAWNEQAGKKDRPETGQPKGMAVPLCSLLKRVKVTGNSRTNLFFGKKALHIPLIGGGRAFEPEVIEDALSKGCDLVFIGRGLLAEPDLINLIREGRFPLARPCIGCNHCVNEQLQFRRRITCAGCAPIGLEDNDYTLTTAEKPKKVAVIGAGPAGMEAARIAAKRGHSVTLYEREPEIGGQIKLAVIPPYKQNILPLMEFYKTQLLENNVNVITDTEVTLDMLKEIAPDVAVFATGTQPFIPHIEGADSKSVLTMREAFHEPVGKNVTVIGGGTIGCELAVTLSQKGSKVTIIEMTNELASKMAKTAQTVLVGHMRHQKVTVLTETTALEITSDGVQVKNAGGEAFIPTDTVIVCVGDKPDTTLYDACSNLLPECYLIGDSNEVGDIRTAVKSGYITAKII